MPGRGLKFDLTMTMASLLITGMLLTDFVIMGLWQYHANQACREKLTQSLALTVAGLQDASAMLPPGDHIRAELEQQGLCLHIVTADKGANLPMQSCQKDRNVATLVEAVLRDGQSVVRPVDRQGQSEWFGRKWLVVAQPLYQGTDLIGAVGLAGPMATIFDLASASQQQILVYILINAIVLTVIGFFRISRQIIRPLERLINLADTYQAQEVVLFSSQNQSNELSQLSASLNSMVQRIEHDTGILKQTIEELAKKNKQLQENQQEMVRAEKLASVGRLAAGLAHEIGNPLGVAQGYLQLLSMEGNREHERSEYVAKALQELGRVDGLIRQLLDYARTSKGAPEQFDVHAFLSELAKSLRAQPFLDGIQLDLALQAESASILADREQLRQVLLNCLLNAADAIKACKEMAAGVISLKTALADPLMMQLAIEDNGEGIRPELLDIVFDPFFTTKEPGAGTGLGLSVSLALIESMGGTIRLQSNAGKGTTVLLTLPLAAETVIGSDPLARGNTEKFIETPREQGC